MIDRLNAAVADRYRVEREIGAGGMATVYLAHDLKHEREVAIKVLHPDLGAALGSERFLSEIKTTAKLQHQHILPLLDSGEADGLLYYVMPLVTGETLRARLERERQLPIADAVRIAREVAGALDYAHRHGVIHRDIKPENILLHDGSALVADFGIALAVQTAAGSRMTQTGLSLGTPQYMSPEQAMGERTIDARSDVYALGAVMYEMLTGQPPFTGATVQAIVAKVLTERPSSIRTTRDTVPAHVEAAVMTSLAKLPADRFADARRFADALTDTGFTSSAVSMPMAVARGPASAPMRRALLVAGAVTAASLAFAAWSWQRGVSEPMPLVPLTLDVPSSVTDLARFAVSGEGRMFAFSTNEGIELRDAGQREYRILQGTKSGESPAFSPDGDWIAYETSGVLRKTPVAGGASLSLIANDSIRAGRVSWGDDGTIVFETGGRLGLMPPNGSLRILAKTQSAQQPRMTPDGRGVLYVNQQRGSKLMYYDLAADTTFVLLDDATEAQYLLTGQLIYASTLGGLYTIRFDPSRHTVSGTPTAVILDMQPNGGVAPFVVTRSGTLVYRAGVDAESRVLLRSAEGKVDTLPLTSRIISYLRFSPDGRRLALSIGSTRGTNRHVALYDFSLGTLTHFTNTGGVHSPVWSPDGSRLAWTMEGPETNAEALVVRPIDQSRPPMRMPALPNDQHATAWPSDTVLVFSTNGGARTLGASESRASSSIVNPLTRTGVRECLNPLWAEYDVAVSPDGQWAAYTSNESGQAEIMVRRFPRADEGGKWKLSSDGGRLARWSADGRTIYHLDRGRTRIRAVGVTPGNNFSVGASSVVMTARQFGSAWDVDRKTGRIAITVPVSTAGARMVVMQNWRELFSRSGKK
jgi:serine/threonine protein kinase/Tol biopolymer transport system component